MQSPLVRWMDIKLSMVRFIVVDHEKLLPDIVSIMQELLLRKSDNLPLEEFPELLEIEQLCLVAEHCQLVPRLVVARWTERPIAVAEGVLLSVDVVSVLNLLLSRCEIIPQDLALVDEHIKVSMYRDVCCVCLVIFQSNTYLHYVVTYLRIQSWLHQNLVLFLVAVPA